MSFRRFFFVRLAWALFAAWLAVTLVFVIFLVLPWHPDRLLAGRPAQPGAVNRVRRELHLDIPVHERYARFFWDFAQDGSLGPSFVPGRSDSRATALKAASATGAVVVPALVFALVAASVAAIPWSRAGPRRRRLWRLPVYLAVGAMPVWVGLWLAFYLGFKWNGLPIAGYCDFFDPPEELGCGGAVDWTKHLILPWITFSLFFAAVYARILRLILRNLRAASDADRGPLARRSALVIARVIGRDLGFAIGAAVMVEVVFGIPGLGRILVSSVGFGDLPVAATILVWASLLAIGIHFLIDVVVCALDADLRAEWPVAITARAT